MVDTPTQVAKGRVTGRFVSFLADSADAGEQPDEATLMGSVTFTPGVSVMRWPSLTPPRTAVLQAIVCPIINGNIYPPGTDPAALPATPGVVLVATEQPYGQPTRVPWTASFKIGSSTSILPPVQFNVIANDVVDLTNVVPASPEPNTVIVVSHEDRLAVEALLDSARTVQVDPGSIAGLPVGTVVVRTV